MFYSGVKRAAFFTAQRRPVSTDLPPVPRATGLLPVRKLELCAARGMPQVSLPEGGHGGEQRGGRCASAAV